MTIEYSVIIRTIGKAGEKYQNLLNSISALVPQPKEVIVVLPEGYDEPTEKLGWETFYYSPKGMVAQRMYGVAQCKSPYALILDDDISFGVDFVQKLHEPIALGLAGLSSGPLYSFLPEKGIRAAVNTLSGAAAPTIFHKDRYVSVLRTAGYSYNRHLQPEKKRFYESQSLAGTCFYADISKLRSIGFEKEKWIDANGYSAYEDQTMFYKAWLRGIRTVVVADAYYVHQDAKTSTRNNKPVVTRCLIINRIIFWHRFIYRIEKTTFAKAWARLAFAYRMVWLRLWAYIDLFRGRYTKEDVQLVFQAIEDGWKYVKTAEYRSLPTVCKE